MIEIEGRVLWELHESGLLVAAGEAHNVCTQVGDQTYAERGAGVAGAPPAATGMKLGTGSTATGKTGAGAALVTYLPNSHQGFDSGFPSSALNGSARRITYQVTFAAGKATSGVPITEAVIVNSALADVTSTAATTMARVLLVGCPGKSVTQVLVVSWAEDVAGA